MARTALFFGTFMLLLCAACKVQTSAEIYDNQFVPFLRRTPIIVPGKKSHFSIDAFFATASKAFNEDGNEVGIPELSGRYDQQAVARSFVALGCENPLPSRFQNQKLLWFSQGKIQAQGLEIAVNQYLFYRFYAGFFAYFMRVDTTSAFSLDRTADIGAASPQFSPGNILLLDRVRRCMNLMAGLKTNDHASQIGFGDLNVYVGWQQDWHYVAKMRSIVAQARVGALIPSGQSRNLNEPTSIPFGGDGFWGAYVTGQSEFELKEDWKAGLMLWISKRFERMKHERIPLFCEPFQYSPFVSSVKINPGPCFVAQLWADFEHVYNGLGARVLLTVRRHWEDSWDILCCPPACDDKTCRNIEELTSWGSDYITLNVFYDFGNTKVCRRSIEPIIFFAWDIPSSMLDTKRTIKTNKIMVGVEFGF